MVIARQPCLRCYRHLNLFVENPIAHFNSHKTAKRFKIPLKKRFIVAQSRQESHSTLKHLPRCRGCARKRCHGVMFHLRSLKKWSRRNWARYVCRELDVVSILLSYGQDFQIWTILSRLWSFQDIKQLLLTSLEITNRQVKNGQLNARKF